MEKEFYLQTAAVEDSHWYMVARRELVRMMLRRVGFRGDSALEVGCGSGGNLGLLGEFCREVTGMDISAEALSMASGKVMSRLVRADSNSLPEPFGEESIDLVADFNMLYHRWISDDKRTIQAMAALLRPGGMLVLFEPAFMALWRRHDEVDMGARRYRLPSVVSVLRASGLELLAGSYFNAWAYLPALVIAQWERAGERRGGGTVKELALPPRALNAFLISWMRTESRWIRMGGRFPLGTTVFCLARKPRQQRT